MNSYIRLHEYLRASGHEEVLIAFSVLETVLGFKLPKSAYTYKAWWSNGEHSQAYAWLHAGYKVDKVNIHGEAVIFRRFDALPLPEVQNKKMRSTPTQKTEFMSVDSKYKTYMAGNYQFNFIQELVPECDAGGNVIKYYPQNDYNNKKGLPLTAHGKGAFCKFSIKAGAWSGVYIWVVDGQIIYIGETAGLMQRFNMGYGHISPRNCYKGGQSTNCKMNKVVLSYYEQGKTICLYFHTTADYKQIERKLLKTISTPCNAKNNSIQL
jgi:hypothetical protein